MDTENLYMDQVEISNNAAEAEGGAIYLEVQYSYDYINPYQIHNCKFLNNIGSDGGAIYIYGNSLELYRNIFDSNYCYYSGGALYLSSN